jgi:hypothetical protein
MGGSGASSKGRATGTGSVRSRIATLNQEYLETQEEMFAAPYDAEDRGQRAHLREKADKIRAERDALAIQLETETGKPVDIAAITRRKKAADARKRRK